jgi:hypothetical protein|uniref:Uncharacterized protein n=1 Tax=Populus trichocarpa TaxID=3694 RepID=A0A2K2A9A2_POPTR
MHYFYHAKLYVPFSHVAVHFPSHHHRHLVEDLRLPKVLCILKEDRKEIQQGIKSSKSAKAVGVEHDSQHA